MHSLQSIVRWNQKTTEAHGARAAIIHDQRLLSQAIAYGDVIHGLPYTLDYLSPNGGNYLLLVQADTPVAKIIEAKAALSERHDVVSCDYRRVS